MKVLVEFYAIVQHPSMSAVEKERKVREFVQGLDGSRQVSNFLIPFFLV